MFAFLKLSTEFCLKQKTKWKRQEIPETWISLQFEAPRYARVILLPQNPLVFVALCTESWGPVPRQILILASSCLNAASAATMMWNVPLAEPCQVVERYFPSLHRELDTISTTEAMFLFDLEELQSEYLLKSVKRFMNNSNGQLIGPQTSTIFQWVSAFDENYTFGCF